MPRLRIWVIPIRSRCLVGAFSNPDRSGSRESGQADAVRLETAPTGGENIHLFLEFAIVYGFGVPVKRRIKREKHIAQCVIRKL